MEGEGWSGERPRVVVDGAANGAPGVVIRPFVPADQPAARRLVLGGLGEHFGRVDPTRNPDLDDIRASYPDRGHPFVVAVIGGEVVATGALVAEGTGVGRLVRVAVSPRHRRRGIGRALVDHLVDTARARGDRRLLVETNDDWHDAIRLYLARGFAETGRRDGEIHLARDL